MGTPQGLEPCPYQSPVLRPRYAVTNTQGFADRHAFPNTCMPCVSDEGNWDCWVYRSYITDLIRNLKREVDEKKKEGVAIEMPEIKIPEKYRETILHLVA